MPTITVGSQSCTLPCTLQLNQNTQNVQVTVASPQTFCGAQCRTQYNFTSWDDGAPQNRTLNVGTSNASYKVNFSTQFYLATAVSPSGGGSISPAPPGAWYNSGTSVPISASASAGYTFTGYSGCVTGNPQSPACVMNGPQTVTANFGPPGYVITSSPTGVTLQVDGVSCTTPCTFSNWAQYSNHILNGSTSPNNGTWYTFSSWSGPGVGVNGTSVSPTVGIQAVSPATYTATYGTAYYLTTATSPSDGGTITAITPSLPGYPPGWYSSGTSVAISASANAGYTFTGYSGCVTGNPQSPACVMNGPQTVTANFVQPILQTVTSNPPGLAVTVDGVTCTAPCVYEWVPGTNHPVTTSSIQSSTSGTQYMFASWSDGGAVTHGLTASASFNTVTANFITQYYLTTASQPGGSIAPMSGWHNSGETVGVSASAGPGYQFAGFIGAISGTGAAQSLTMTGPASVTATFTRDGAVINPMPALMNADTGGNPIVHPAQSAPSPTVEPGTTQNLGVCLIDQNTGNIVQVSGVRITIQSVTGQAYSGYHNHNNADRPVGYFQSLSGVTRGNGCFPDMYTDAPGIAGVDVVSLYADGYGASTSNIVIQHAGLVQIPPSRPSYTLKAPNPEHLDAYNCTQYCVDNTAAICDDYFEVTGFTVMLNDASLPWGGRFDLGPRYLTSINGVQAQGIEWGPPHQARVAGLNIDIPYSQFYNPNAAQGHQWDWRSVFNAVLNLHRAARPWPEGNHYHLRYSH